MKQIDSINVLFHGKIVGELTLTPGGQCAFQYSKEWLASGFSISPIQLPLKNELFIAPQTPFWGNFGIFEDSMPDGYGRYLLNRMLKRQGINDTNLTVLQRLSLIGNSGMGALCYEPVSKLSISSTEQTDFDEIQQKALDILSEKSDSDADLLYFKSGNSGGCRPKVVFSDNEGHWIVKFRHTYDPHDMGKMEYHYNEMARRCGIQVPDFKLINGKYFASKRFDIENGERIHVATAAALLNTSIQQPTLDYKNLLHLTGLLTQNPADVEEMYRRMVFNVLAKNKDDHAKNFSFIYKDGKWHLAPAYDLTLCEEGYHGEHATSVMGNGNPTTSDMVAAGESIRIPKQRCMEIIEAVAEVTRQLGY